MAELKDFGTVKSWYTAYKQTQINEKKVEKEDVKVLPDDEDKEKEKKPEPKDKAIDDADGLKTENEKLKAEIEKLKLDLKKKDSETNVEPNADTGEVPLRVGIAQSILDKKKKQKQEVKEDHEISMARGELEAISDKALELSSSLKSKLDSGQLDTMNPLEAWVQSKITKAKDYINSAYDYMMYKPEEVQEMAKDDAYAIGMSVAKKKMKDEPPLDKKTIKKGHEIAKKILKGETANESVSDYAKKLSDYAAKRGGIDKKDFMMLSKQMKKAKSDMDLKKIARRIDDMDTEPRDLVKGSIALQLGPKTFKKMFGDRLTSSDMNQYKRMTPRSMREEVELDEGKVKEVMMTVHDVLKKEGGAAGFDVIRKAVKKQDGINITKDSVKRLPGVKLHKFGDFILESKEETLDELKEPFIVIDTAQGNKVVGMASDEKEAQSIISSSERPPMRIKNKKTLKIVKVRRKQMIGRPLKEETLDEVNMKDGTMTSRQLDSLKKSYSTVGNTIAPEKSVALSKMLDRFGEGELRQLVRKDIKFVSTLAVNKLIMKHKYKAKDIHDIRKK